MSLNLRTPGLKILCAFRSACDDEFFERGRQDCEVGFGECVHEVGRVGPDVVAYVRERVFPPLFKPNTNATTVVGGNLAAYEASSFKSFQERRDRRSGHVQSVGKLGIAQSTFFIKEGEEAKLCDREVFTVPNMEANGVEQRAGSKKCVDRAVSGGWRCFGGHPTNYTHVGPLGVNVPGKRLTFW